MCQHSSASKVHHFFSWPFLAQALLSEEIIVSLVYPLFFSDFPGEVISPVKEFFHVITPFNVYIMSILSYLSAFSTPEQFVCVCMRDKVSKW